MESFLGKVSPEVNEKEEKDFNYKGSSPLGKEDSEVSSAEEGDHLSDKNICLAQNQLVVYDPLASGSEAVLAPRPLNSQPPSASRVLPVINSFTVQCANCFQWRLIPTQEKYEEIRETIIEKPFYCQTVSEWRPGVSCDDPGDIQQDNTRLWAIDRPNIARPPPGWQRLLRLRGEGSSKFADVYYVAPSGKRFRSLVEIQKYLADNPDLAAETNISQFTFQIPRPLQEDYVKKRPSGMKSSRLLDSGEVTPSDSVDVLLGQPEPQLSSFETPVCKSSHEPAKKRAKKPLHHGSTPLS